MCPEPGYCTVFLFIGAPKETTLVLFPFMFSSGCACIYLFVPKQNILLRWKQIFPARHLALCASFLCVIPHLLLHVLQVNVVSAICLPLYSLCALVCLLIRCTSVLSLLINPFFGEAASLSPAHSLCFSQSQVHFPQ